MFSFLALGERVEISLSRKNVYILYVLGISLWEDHSRKEQDWQFWAPWLTFQPEDWCGTCWPDHPAVLPSLGTKIFDIIRHSKNVSHGVWCLCGLPESWVSICAVLDLVHCTGIFFPASLHKQQVLVQGRGKYWTASSLMQVNQSPSDSWSLATDSTVRREEGFHLKVIPGGWKIPLGRCSLLGWVRSLCGNSSIQANPVDSKVWLLRTRAIGKGRANDGQTHLNDERKLWIPLAVRTGLQTCDRFLQGARRCNSFKACKGE